MSYIIQDSVTTIDTTITTSKKWSGGVLANDGKIYGIPHNSPNILVIDPSTDTTTTIALPTTSTINPNDIEKWLGGVLGADGKIYGIPHNASYVLVIDVAVSPPVISTIGSGTGNNTPMNGLYKWAGGVLAPNGKIYCAPYNSTSMLVIDPVASTKLTLVTNKIILSVPAKWSGGVLAANGKVYFMPCSDTRVLIVTPSNNSLATIGNITGTNKYQGGVLGADGKIYATPFNKDTILVIDPIANTTTTVGALTIPINPSTNLPVNNTYLGGVVGLNDKIYMFPHNLSNILVIDPTPTSTNTTFTQSLTTVDSIPSKWDGGVLAPNGKIYSIPHDSQYVLVITTSSTWALSASYNKY